MATKYSKGQLDALIGQAVGQKYGLQGWNTGSNMGRIYAQQVRRRNEEERKRRAAQKFQAQAKAWSPVAQGIANMPGTGKSFSPNMTASDALFNLISPKSGPAAQPAQQQFTTESVPGKAVEGAGGFFKDLMNLPGAVGKDLVDEYKKGEYAEGGLGAAMPAFKVAGKYGKAIGKGILTDLYETSKQLNPSKGAVRDMERGEEVLAAFFSGDGKKLEELGEEQQQQGFVDKLKENFSPNTRLIEKTKEDPFGNLLTVGGSLGLGAGATVKGVKGAALIGRAKKINKGVRTSKIKDATRVLDEATSKTKTADEARRAASKVATTIDEPAHWRAQARAAYKRSQKATNKVDKKAAMKEFSAHLKKAREADDALKALGDVSKVSKTDVPDTLGSLMSNLSKTTDAKKGLKAAEDAPRKSLLDVLSQAHQIGKRTKSRSEFRRVAIAKEMGMTPREMRRGLGPVGRLLSDPSYAAPAVLREVVKSESKIEKALNAIVPTLKPTRRVKQGSRLDDELGTILANNKELAASDNFDDIFNALKDKGLSDKQAAKGRDAWQAYKPVVDKYKKKLEDAMADGTYKGKVKKEGYFTWLDADFKRRAEGSVKGVKKGEVETRIAGSMKQRTKDVAPDYVSFKEVVKSYAPTMERSLAYHPAEIAKINKIIRGYKGGRKTYAQKFFKEQVLFGRGAPSKAEKLIEGVTKKAAQSVISGIGRTKFKPGTKRYLEKKAAKIYRPSQLTKGALGVNRFWYNTILGATNPSAAAKQYFQRIPMANLAGWKNAIQAQGMQFTKKGRAVLDEIDARHYKGDNLSELVETNTKSSLVGRILDRTEKANLRLFEFAEQGNRKTAKIAGFLQEMKKNKSAFAKADDAGKKKLLEEAYDRGKLIETETQYRYGKLGESPYLRGPVGRAGTLFTSFPRKTAQMFMKQAQGEVAGGRAALAKSVGQMGAIEYARREGLPISLENVWGRGMFPIEQISQSKGGWNPANTAKALFPTMGGTVVAAGQDIISDRQGSFRTKWNKLKRQLTPPGIRKSKVALDAIKNDYNVDWEFPERSFDGGKTFSDRKTVKLGKSSPLEELSNFLSMGSPTRDKGWKRYIEAKNDPKKKALVKQRLEELTDLYGYKFDKKKLDEMEKIAKMLGLEP